MHIVKMMAWESSFMKRITDARLVEIKFVRLAIIVQAATFALVLATPVALSIVTFGIYGFMGGLSDAAVVFPAISLFPILRTAMNVFQIALTQLARIMAAIERIQRFIDAEELHSLANSPEHAVALETFVHMNADVIPIDASLSWDRNLVTSVGPTLSKISCVIPRGSPTCIVGSTAAGKSTFLSAIIDEVERLGGRVGVRPGIRSALCGQTPFIRNCTLRDNVLFGSSPDMERYRRKLRVCNLLPDLLTLPAGDSTEIGDRGTNLSGGQKARDSLALAVYNQHEIVLLDAPLAAGDAHVVRSIFDNCVVNEMVGRTRLMTTNSLNFASSPDVDYIVVLENGKMVEFGKNEELLADSSSRFAKMIPSESADSSEQANDENGAERDCGKNTDSITTEKVSRKSKFAVAIASHDESSIKDADELLVDIQKVENITEVERNRRGELFHRETKEVGTVRQRHFLEYMNAAGGMKWVAFILSLSVLSQTLAVGVNVWRSIWSECTRLQSAEAVMAEQMRNLVINTLLCACTIFVTAVQMFVLASVSVSIRASVWLHEKLMISVFGAPMSFFDTTPTGRIVNRLNASIDSIDKLIIFCIRAILGLAFMGLVRTSAADALILKKYTG